VKRDELEHIIRAAARITGGDEIVVIGSQAILGQYPDAPASLLRSLEADVYPRSHPDRAEEIDGAIGDGSQFHATFGYYAHGVGPETAKAPAGWEGRLVRVTVELVRGGTATGWCLEAHDLVLAKCVAGRDRDWDFAKDALGAGVVHLDELGRRIRDLPIARDGQKRIAGLLQGFAA
jgi:hypothetical protein